MRIIDIVGFTAAVIGTASFLPQVIKSWRTKKTSDISFLTYLGIATATFLWTTYGWLTSQPSIYLSNAIVFLLSVSLLILKVKYG